MTKTVLNPEEVKALFEKYEHQADILVELCKMVIPEWDDVEKIDGWPRCNSTTWKMIHRLFVEFDKVHHPKVMAGGLWFNKGFSAGDAHDYLDWEVDTDHLKFEMKEV